MPPRITKVMPVAPNENASASNFSNRLADLRGRFTQRALEDRVTLEDAVLRKDHAVLRERAHRLAGTAPSFGLTGIGSAARKVDNLAQAGVDESQLFEAARKLIELLGRCEDRND